MILERHEYTTLPEFIQDNAGTDLAIKCIQAFIQYRNSEDEEDYVIVKVEGYYSITKIIDEWEPKEVSEYIQPFDEKKVYPLQKMQKTISFVY